MADGELSLPEFHLYRCERPTITPSLHGGVMIAIFNSFLHAPLDTDGPTDITACSIGPGYEVHLFCVYNPPKQSPYRWPQSKWKSLIDIWVKLELHAF